MVLGAGAVAAATQMTPQNMDPLKLSPQYYTLKLENDRVRVLEYRLKPGEKEVMHSHPPGGFVYSMADAKTRTTLPDGKVSEGSSTAGRVTWRESTTTHALENIGTTDMHNLAVDVKPCPQ
jgi:hypothetical protein